MAIRTGNGDVVRHKQVRFQTYDYSRADASLERFWREVEERS